MTQGVDRTDAESDIWSAIVAFEKIVEAMPEDRDSLAALAHAYEQIGDRARAVEYWRRLGGATLRAGDAAGAGVVAERMGALADGDAETETLLAALKALHAEAGQASQDGATPPPGREVSVGFNMDAELSLAWSLLEEGDLSEEQYAELVQDLSEMACGESGAVVSTLHVLEARDAKKLERVMGVLAKRHATPIVTLSAFEFNEQAVGRLPTEFMSGRGAMAFESMGQEALVAVLNPADEQLRKDCATLAGCPCHFFLTLPTEFDLALRRWRTLQEEIASATEP